MHTRTGILRTSSLLTTPSVHLLLSPLRHRRASIIMADPHLTLSSLLLSLLKSAPQCKMTLVKREFERSPNGGLNLHDFMHALLTHLAMDVSEEKDKRIEEELEILVDDIERMFSQVKNPIIC